MLRVRGLEAGYGGTLVLRGVDIEVDDGEFVCVMGRNGTGKTTLLETIMGSLRPRAGGIEVVGHDVTGSPPHVRARLGVGYVPQGRGVFGQLTVAENLLVAAEAVRAPRGRLDEAVDLFPRLRPLLDRDAGSLSGGQQQQLAFARALVGAPRLLLLDEPTEGIQPSIIQEIEDALARLKASREIAVLLVEQYLDFALRLADRSYVIDRGRIAAEGVPDELDRDALQEHLVV